MTAKKLWTIDKLKKGIIEPKSSMKSKKEVLSSDKVEKIKSKRFSLTWS